MDELRQRREMSFPDRPLFRRCVTIVADVAQRWATDAERSKPDLSK
jgi:phytoene/squalene synthetase